ncbi:MAG: pyrimidine/purine nucleoside phosphorylase [Bacteroidota bacterium]
MFETNEYFDGKVKSIAFETEEGRATIGVMAPGEYAFGTTTIEYMTVISGEMTVLLPGDKEWKTFKASETFMVDKNKKFGAKTTQDTAYKCLYK